MNALPPYRELPVMDGPGEYRHAWDHFPADDDFGCLRNLTPQARQRGMATVTEHEVVNLSLPLTHPDPPMTSRESLRHTIFELSRNSMDDRLDNFFLQASTQWDGFRHIRAREHGFFTGHPGGFADGDTRLGIDHWARTGIIGRGVLIDVSSPFRDLVARGAGDERCVIDADMLRAAAEQTPIEPGDVVCLRTGWMEHYWNCDQAARSRLADSRRWPGLSASAAMAELLWDWRISALIADNPAVEVSPGQPEVGFLHRRLIPLLGLPLGELFDLEQLADRCAALGRGEFLFVSVPLNLPGGVGSPGNAVAML